MTDYLLISEICEDCPPRSYPTDETRCRQCPLQSARILYRYSVEYARGAARGNAFVRGCDEKEARAQFKALYPGADIERITSLGEAQR